MAAPMLKHVGRKSPRNLRIYWTLQGKMYPKTIVNMYQKYSSATESNIQFFRCFSTAICRSQRDGPRVRDPSPRRQPIKRQKMTPRNKASKEGESAKQRSMFDQQKDITRSSSSSFATEEYTDDIFGIEENFTVPENFPHAYQPKEERKQYRKMLQKKYLSNNKNYAGTEIYFENPYGMIRMDDDNKPALHQQQSEEETWGEEYSFYDDNEFRTHTKVGSKQTGPRENKKQTRKEKSVENFIESQYFGDVQDTVVDSMSHETRGYFDEQTNNLIDDQYFENSYKETSDISSNHYQTQPKQNLDARMGIDGQFFSEADVSESRTTSIDNLSQEQLDAINRHHNSRDESTNYIDEQYFNEEEFRSASTKDLSQVQCDAKNRHRSSPSGSLNYIDQQYIHREEPNKNLPEYSSVQRKTKSETKDEDNTDYVETVTKQETRWRWNKPNLEKPKTAYDLAMKIRLEQQGRKIQKDDKGTLKVGKFDEKGFRILSSQTPQWHKMLSDVIVKILKDSVLHETDDFIALQKPYGLPVEASPALHTSIIDLLPRLSEALDATNPLQVVTKPGMNTSGVMLIAKNSAMYQKLMKMFHNNELHMSYWCITKGVPQPEAGIIDIPLGLSGRKFQKSEKIFKMVLKPDYTDETKSFVKRSTMDTFRAITHYRVLDHHNSAALVEVQPKTQVKHQIRCHLGHALNTPILGDHKYSYFTKNVPQTLPPDMLERLRVRQAKVRYIPMHLNLNSIMIPEFNSGRNLFIKTRLPWHFLDNMRRLKLKPPKKRHHIDRVTDAMPFAH